MLHACIKKFDVTRTVKNSMLHACASIAAPCASTVDPIKKGLVTESGWVFVYLHEWPPWVYWWQQEQGHWQLHCFPLAGSSSDSSSVWPGRLAACCRDQKMPAPGGIRGLSRRRSALIAREDKGHAEHAGGASCGSGGHRALQGARYSYTRSACLSAPCPCG